MKTFQPPSMTPNLGSGPHFCTPSIFGTNY